MEKNNFLKLSSRYYIKTRAANLLRTSFEIRCEPTVEAKRTTSMWLLYKYGKYRTLGGRLLAQLLHVNTPQSWQLDSKCATVSDSKAQVKCNYNGNKSLECAMRSGYHLPQTCRFFMIITERDGQPISMLNKSVIENPSAQKCSGQHFLTVGYLH